MNKEEVTSKLCRIYEGDRNALEEMIGYYDGLKQIIELLQEENARLIAQQIENKWMPL